MRQKGPFQAAFSLEFVLLKVKIQFYRYFFLIAGYKAPEPVILFDMSEDGFDHPVFPFH
ncbi:hypothetical protein [Mucilaginibacter sp.]|uniref:hypothetical protein n=1 Tax=Mucilaginibacter sp. TaxID=1882438 RepID=UPI0026077AAE|nr:hypothetical protein [Mucilaginibacter sp.]MDB4922974.1 hypothetical protein [Mucilaginibacter sp.]